MKKLKIITLFFLLSIFNISYGDNTLKQDLTIKSINIIDGYSYNIFELPNKYFSFFRKNSDLLCFSKNKKVDFIKFDCNDNLGGCGIVFTDKKLEKFNGKCLLKIKNKKYLLNINKKSLYKNSMDISNNFYKTSIQQKTLSCEISATSDIISTMKNKNITENELLKKLDKSKYYNKKAIKKRNGTRIWGDPNKGYVGHIHLYKNRQALQYKYEGYGVYEKPIKKLYKKYGLDSKIINNKNYNISFGEKEHLTELLKELNKGNYIQLWGDYCTYEEYEDGKIELDKNEKLSNYQIKKGLNAKNICYKGGKTNRELNWYYYENNKRYKIKGLNGEHAFYLLGYKGEINSPTHIIVWDTFTGKHSYKTEEWLRKWRMVNNRSLIIYPNKQIKNTKISIF